MNGQKLIIFVKNEGKIPVKTRLASHIGAYEAINIYRRLLAYTGQIVRTISADVQVQYTPSIPERIEIWDSETSFGLQSGNGLGERMEHAFRHAFEQGYDRVVLIGSDCGEITAEILEAAFLRLKTNEIVIGPARDGGYYLIGMSEFEPTLFREMEWSTSTVLYETKQRIQKSGRSSFSLPELGDVDTIEDWNRVKHRFE